MHDQLHPLPLASAARFRIRHAYPVSFVIEANGCGYAQGPFWLPWRFALVGQGNQIEDVRFLFSPLTMSLLWPPKRKYNAVSTERSMKFGNIVRVKTLRYLTKITALQRKADCEGSYSQAYGFASITMYSWWQSSEIGCAYRI